MGIAIGNVWWVKESIERERKRKEITIGNFCVEKECKKEKKKEKRNMDGVQYLIEYLNCFIISDNIWKTDLTNLRC